MSINFYESTPKEISEDLREKYNESWGESNRHKLFTEDELNQLLKLCKLSENGAELRYGVDGFSLVSDDRAPIEAMLEAKKDASPYREKLAQKIAKVTDEVMEDVMEFVVSKSGPLVMPEKEAWQKYQDYCQEQIKNCEPDSKEYRYYIGEVAKCLEEINRL